MHEAIRAALTIAKSAGDDRTKKERSDRAMYMAFLIKRLSVGN